MSPSKERYRLATYRVWTDHKPVPEVVVRELRGHLWHVILDLMNPSASEVRLHLAMLRISEEDVIDMWRLDEI